MAIQIDVYNQNKKSSTPKGNTICRLHGRAFFAPFLNKKKFSLLENWGKAEWERKTGMQVKNLIKPGRL